MTLLTKKLAECRKCKLLICDTILNFVWVVSAIACLTNFFLVICIARKELYIVTWDSERVIIDLIKVYKLRKPITTKNESPTTKILCHANYMSNNIRSILKWRRLHHEFQMQPINLIRKNDWKSGNFYF